MTITYTEPTSPLAGRPRITGTEDLIAGGSTDGLNFRLENRTRLTFCVGNHEVWTQPDLTLEELAYLLRGLAGAWDALTVQESYPFSVSVDKPSQLKAALWQVLLGISEVELAVEAYRLSHDMAAWLGIEEPSLWFVREGLRMVVEADNIARRIDGAQALWTLERLGDILSQVVKEAHPDAREAWRNRVTFDAGSIERLVRMNVGASEERTQELFDRKIIELPTRRSDAMRGLDAVLAAARMWPAFVPVDDLARVATEIRAVPHSATPKLDKLSEEAAAVIEDDDDKGPRDSALKLAAWLRKQLGLTDYDRADPQEILQCWGVLTHRISLIEQIDAVSFWGGSHGPCILLNPDSRKASTGVQGPDGLTGAMRFTLAHEICHLLVDRNGSLPVAEVLGGATPARSETRADIFASHFLLPFAAVEHHRANSHDLEDCIGRLTAAFGVSRSLAAAQLLWRDYNSLSRTERDWLGGVIRGHTSWVVR